MKCPNCQEEIAVEDVNIQKDIAMCRPCKKVYSITHDLGHEISKTPTDAGFEDDLRDFDIANPPDNKTWVRQTTQGIAIGASTRSAIAIVFIIFLLVFGGISTTVFGVLIFAGDIEAETMIFFLPFFFVDLLLLVFIGFSLYGKAEVLIDRFEGEVFVGAFSFGWRKRFNVKEIQAVQEEYSGVRVNNRPKKHIVLVTEAGNKISFGSMLKNERRRFIYLALHKYFRQLNQKMGR